MKALIFIRSGTAGGFTGDIRQLLQIYGIQPVLLGSGPGIFNLLNLAVFANGEKNSPTIILISTAIARVISATVNFLINRKFVFGKRGNAGKSFIRYTILCVAVMLLSAGGTWLLSQTGMSSTIAKLITDALLYFVSYRFQERWVFKEEVPHE